MAHQAVREEVWEPWPAALEEVVVLGATPAGELVFVAANVMDWEPVVVLEVMAAMVKAGRPAIRHPLRLSAEFISRRLVRPNLVRAEEAEAKGAAVEAPEMARVPASTVVEIPTAVQVGRAAAAGMAAQVALEVAVLLPFLL
jgi:hypothetical protein